MLRLSCFLVVFTSIVELGSPQLTQVTTKYYISNIALEYVQAYAVCRRNGYHLATEQNANETTQINAAIEAAGYTSRNWWLAGVNITEGEFDPAWVWIESGEELDYTNWQEGQPGGDLNCLMKYSLDQSSGQWGNRGCTSPLWFICQKP